MALLSNAIHRFCVEQGLDKTFWVGFSGGLDSHVLLHAISALSKQHSIQVKAVHVHHGLSSNASQWADHCAAVCRDLDIDLVQKTLLLDKKLGESLEASAREARYQAMRDLITNDAVLLTAHHQDDQAETLLLQLIRGAGIKGLAAMPVLKSFAEGVHGRPLLSISRAEMQTYAEQHALTWIEDESNSNVAFSRNFLRQDIFPLLKKRWPSVAATFARVAEHCAEAQNLVDQMIDVDIATVADGDSLSISALRQFSQERQRQIMRGWLMKCQYPLPSLAKLEQLQHQFLQAAEDRFPHVVWGGVEMRRYQDRLYVMACLPEHGMTERYVWQLGTELMIPAVGLLQSKKVMGEGLKVSIGSVEVRFRQGGEVCRLPGRDCRHALKKLFQQWKIPSWQRDRIPLLFVEETLVAIPGYYVHEDYAALGEEAGWSVSLSLAPTSKPTY